MRWIVADARDWERVASFCGRFSAELNNNNKLVCLDEGGECPFNGKSCLMTQIFDLLNNNLNIEDLEIIHSLPIEGVINDLNPNVREIVEMVKGWKELVGDGDRNEVS